MGEGDEQFSVKCTDEKVFKAIKEFIDTDGTCMVTFTKALGCEKISDPKAYKA